MCGVVDCGETKLFLDVDSCVHPRSFSFVVDHREPAQSYNVFQHASVLSAQSARLGSCAAGAGSSLQVDAARRSPDRPQSVSEHLAGRCPDLAVEQMADVLDGGRGTHITRRRTSRRPTIPHSCWTALTTTGSLQIGFGVLAAVPRTGLVYPLLGRPHDSLLSRGDDG